MKYALLAVPAVLAVSLGFGAPAASADELPLPLPTAALQPVTDLLPVPLPTPSPSLLPVPLPAPLPTTEPSQVTTTSKAASTAVVPKVRSESRTQPVAAAAPRGTSVRTGATRGLRFSSATSPAWGSYLTRPAAPTVAAAPAPVALSAARPGALPTDPAGLPGAITLLAILSLAVTAAGHVLVRRGVLPLR